MRGKGWAGVWLLAAVLGTGWSAELIVPNGTRITCRLEQTLSSATAEEGQQVQLSVTENVKVNDVVVIPQGAPVIGNVVVAQGKRSMGRTGKLDFSIDKVRAADGEFIPIRYSMQRREGGSKGVSTGVMTAGAAVLFWPAAPFILLRKGKDVTLNKGMQLEVFTDQDHTVRQHRAGAAPPGVQTAPVPGAVPAAPLAAGEPASVSITSDPPGAEIEIDGAFVGSTPGSARLSAGIHKITVKLGARVWSRDLSVQAGGSINVNAVLTK